MRLRRDHRSDLAGRAVLPRLPQERRLGRLRGDQQSLSGGAPTRNSSITRSPPRSAWPSRAPCCCPPRITRTDTNNNSFRNLAYPHRLGSIFNYVGWPAYFKPFAGGGWKNVYQAHRPGRVLSTPTTRDRPARDDAAGGGSSSTEYYRCYCIDQRHVRIMPYEPRNPHHLRYSGGSFQGTSRVARPDRARRASRSTASSATTSTRWSSRCATASPIAIDFCNPAPDAEATSVGPENFEWVVEARRPDGHAQGQGAPDPRPEQPDLGQIHPGRRSREVLVGNGLRSREEPRGWKMEDGRRPHGSFARLLLARLPSAICPSSRPCPRLPSTSFTLGIEEEFQIVDPETRELRSHIQQILEDGTVIAAGKRVKPEMHQSVVETGTDICAERRRGAFRRESSCAAISPASPTSRDGLKHRLGRHASVLALARPADHRGRALQDHRQGPSAGRARQPHLRAARPRRHPRPRDRDPRDEPDALLPAASLRALDELAVLDRSQHRLQEAIASRSSSASRAPASPRSSSPSPNTRTT